ncbi:MAG TPA: hypothetical protein VFT82_03455 [Candidatus Paceibacterota bacterium]|nr:hypothetical protein [Candidatus Paceibacterota bacterium]
MKSNSKNLIITIAIIIVIGVAGYYYTTRDRSSDQLLISDFSTSSPAVDNDLLTALRALKQIRLDDSIFKNPVWTSLTDFSKTIPTEVPGRQNPFSPLSGVATSTQ